MYRDSTITMNGETQACSNCQKEVSITNFEIHVAHCLRNIVVCEKCLLPVCRKTMDNHLDTAHAKVSCKKCNQQFEAWQTEDHKDSCNKRPIPCIFCEQECPWDRLKDHESYCGSRTEPCERCKKRVLRKDLEDHAKKCKGNPSVSNEIILCPFCGISMMPEYKQNHISICIRCPKTKIFQKNEDEKIRNNLWNSDETPDREKDDAESLSTIVESMSKLTTSESPISFENDTQARYAPLAPILSEPVLRADKRSCSDLEKKIQSERMRNNSPVAQDSINEEDDNSESVLDILQKCRQPLTADSELQASSSAEATVPKQITSQNAVNRISRSGLGRGYPYHLVQRNVTDPGEPTGAAYQETQRTHDDVLQMEVPCPICKKDIPINALEVHVLDCKVRHSNSRSTCPYCNAELSPHEKDNHVNTCNLKFENPAKYEMSMSRSSKKKNKKRGILKHQNARNVSPHAEYNAATWSAEIPCEFCSKPFPFEKIIEHQSGCRPDLAVFHRGDEHHEEPDKQPDIRGEQNYASQSRFSYMDNQTNIDRFEDNANQSENIGIEDNASQSRNLSIEDEANQSNNPGIVDISIQSRNFVTMDSSNQSRNSNDEKTHVQRRQFSHTRPNTSVGLYAPKANQSLAKVDSYQSLQSSFQRNLGKRPGTNYQRYKYERDVTPGEFLPNMRFAGFPDCFNLYKNNYMPPPYPGPLVFIGAPSVVEHMYRGPSNTSYADTLKGSYESEHYHEKEKRWKKGSGTYESKSSESDELISPEEDDSDQSSVYASCHSDIDSGDQRQGHPNQESGSKNDAVIGEHSHTRAVRGNPTKKSRKDKKTSRGGKKR